MSELARAVLAGFAASAAFVAILHAVTHPAFFPGSRPAASLVLALAAYAGVFLLLPRRRSLAERIGESLGGDGALISAEEVAQALIGARDRVDALRASAGALPAGEADRVAGLADLADRIIARVEEDPSDLRRVRQFLRRDLDAAADLVDRFARLDPAALEADRAAETARRFDGALDDFARLFQKYHAKTYDDDLFELEARLQLLEESGRKA
ncbi:MAG: hypothetical protein GVY13_13845 [Alphaproteobacteria bacterium]|jgi:hypothetical protein|nr:hypothetical protein [Alphaproteobacteria bacterium]